MEEIVFHRYPKWKHVLRIGYLSVVETLGYRQLNSWWRITGLWEAMRKKQGWGAMTRTGSTAGERQSFGGGRYWSLRGEIEERMAANRAVIEDVQMLAAREPVGVGRRRPCTCWMRSHGEALKHPGGSCRAALVASDDEDRLPAAERAEIVCALGLGAQLVGVTHECDSPAFVRDLPKVTTTFIPMMRGQ